MDKKAYILIFFSIIIQFLFQKILFCQKNNSFEEKERPREERISVGYAFGYSTFEKTFSWFLNDYMPISFCINYTKTESFKYIKQIEPTNYLYGNIMTYLEGRRIYSIPISLNVGLSVAKLLNYKADSYFSVGLSYLPLFYADIREFEWENFGFRYNLGFLFPVSKLIALGIEYRKLQSFKTPNFLREKNINFSSVNLSLSYYPTRDVGHPTEEKKFSVGLNAALEGNLSGQIGTSGSLICEYRFTNKFSIKPKFTIYGDGMVGNEFSILFQFWMRNLVPIGSIKSGSETYQLLAPGYFSLGPCIANYNNELTFGVCWEFPFLPKFNPNYEYTYNFIPTMGLKLFKNNNKEDPLLVIIQLNLSFGFKVNI